MKRYVVEVLEDIKEEGKQGFIKKGGDIEYIWVEWSGIKHKKIEEAIEERNRVQRDFLYISRIIVKEYTI